MSSSIERIGNMPSVPPISDGKQAMMACIQIDTIEDALKATEEIHARFAEFIDYSIEVYKRVAEFYKASGEKVKRDRAIISFFMTATDDEIAEARAFCISQGKNIRCAVTNANRQKKCQQYIDQANRDCLYVADEYKDEGYTDFSGYFKYSSTSGCEYFVGLIRQRMKAKLLESGAFEYRRGLYNLSTENGVNKLKEQIVKDAGSTLSMLEQIVDAAMKLDDPVDFLEQNIPEVRWSKVIGR